MDPLVSINTDGLAKCMEIIAHCTGWHAHGIKKDAEAQYYADEMTVKSANNVALLKEQGNDALAEYVVRREQRKASNVASIARKAAEQFTPGEQVPKESPSQDWLNRYFDYAEDISEEEMQNLWAKLLHDEIKKPNTFSKRTLDVVRNLSSEEANLMTKYAGRVIQNHIPYVESDEGLLDMTKLDDAGLLNSSNLTWSMKIKKDEQRVVCADNNLIMMLRAKEDVEVTYGIRVLTEAGRQIVSLIDPQLDMLFMGRLADKIVKDKNVIITLHQVNTRVGETYNYQKSPIWTKLHS